MAGGRTGCGSRRRPRAASVVVPFPQGAVGDRLDLARVAPSGRSLLLGFVLVAAVLLAYWGARSTSVFAVERVDVQGAPPAVARDVRKATRETVGGSLLAVDARAIEDALRALPSVAGASVDRAFPHTLVIKVAPERPVAVIRRGQEAWLATGTGRLIREIDVGSHRGFPRLWLKREVAVDVGKRLPASLAEATRALAAARDVRIPHGVQAVRAADGQLTLVLRGGPEIRLGAPRQVALKLAVASRVFPLLADGTVYVDVSVPERPVASTSANSQP
jgi:cell division protein FtsQ